MPRYFDISRPLRADLAVWPGDPKFAFDLRARRVNGEGTNVGTIATSLHAGTHADSFFHYDNEGAAIDALDPDIFIGPCVVIDVSGRSTVGVASVANALARLGIDRPPPRVLLRTGAWPEDRVFPRDFPGIDPPLAAWLGERGVTLLGVDVPSVDAMTTRGLPAHLALGAARITILESLQLAEVPPGEYELMALPLRIVGGDGSPIRAVLRDAGSSV